MIVFPMSNEPLKIKEKDMHWGNTQEGVVYSGYFSNSLCHITPLYLQRDDQKGDLQLVGGEV